MKTWLRNLVGAILFVYMYFTSTDPVDELSEEDVGYDPFDRIDRQALWVVYTDGEIEALPMTLDVKIDMFGRVFFKEHNKWVIQEDIVEIHFNADNIRIG